MQIYIAVFQLHKQHIINLANISTFCFCFLLLLSRRSTTQKFQTITII